MFLGHLAGGNQVGEKLRMHEQESDHIKPLKLIFSNHQGERSVRHRVPPVLQDTRKERKRHLKASNQNALEKGRSDTGIIGDYTFQAFLTPGKVPAGMPFKAAFQPGGDDGKNQGIPVQTAAGGETLDRWFGPLYTPFDPLNKRKDLFSCANSLDLPRSSATLQIPIIVRICLLDE